MNGEGVPWQINLASYHNCCRLPGNTLATNDCTCTVHDGSPSARLMPSSSSKVLSVSTTVGWYEAWKQALKVFRASLIHLSVARALLLLLLLLQGGLEAGLQYFELAFKFLDRIEMPPDNQK